MIFKRNNSFIKEGAYLLDSIDDLDTSSVQYMDNVFDRCISLTSLILTNFETRSSNNMESMFYSCSKLSTLKITNFRNYSKLDILRSKISEKIPIYKATEKEISASPVG